MGKVTTILFIIVVLISCKKEAEILPKDYPYVIMEDIGLIDNEGAVIEAKVLNLGYDEIIRHGFVWRKSQPNPTLFNNNISIDGAPQESLYSYKINSGLVVGEIYYVRAYIETQKNIVYSNEVPFTSKGSTYFPWIQKNNFSQVEVNSASFSLNDKGFVINPQSSTMFRYNPLSDNWTNSISLPENSGALPLAINVNGMAYILLNNNLWKFNGEDNWEFKSKFPYWIGYQREAVFIIQVENSVGIGYIGGVSEPYFYIYDFQKDIWVEKENVPENTGLWVQGNFASSANGISFLGINFDSGNQFWEFDPLNETWTHLGNFPLESYSSWANFVIDNQLYIGLGNTRDGKNGYVSNAMWKYDTSKKDWMRYNDCPEKLPAYASFTIEDKGYIVSTNSVWEFDPSKN